MKYLLNRIKRTDEYEIGMFAALSGAAIAVCFVVSSICAPGVPHDKPLKDQGSLKIWNGKEYVQHK